MKRITSVNYSLLFLIIIGVLASVLRLLWIDRVPNSITYDQLHYILNSLSFLMTGRDISGTITPFHLLIFYYAKDVLVQAELPFFLQLFSLRILPLSLFTVTFPNIILSILTVGVLYLIGTRLFDKTTGLFVSFISAINPWFIFSGRTFYEVVPATFFYLCGFYILLITKGWRILWAFPVFLLAFYSYIATKLIFFPFIGFVVFYCYFIIHKRKYTLQYAVLLGFSLILIIFFMFQLHNQPEISRLNEIITPYHSSIAQQVDTIHRVSLSTPFTSFLENKITIYLRILIGNFFNIFNLNYLFLSGDTFFSMYRHGLFYIIDLIFLGAGALWLFIRKWTLFILFLAIIVLSTLPQIVHSSESADNFTPHIALLFPFFIVVIGNGIAEIVQQVNKNIRSLFICGVVFLYVLSLINFLNIYFSQFPLQSGIFDFSSRLLAKYIALNQREARNIIVYSLRPEDSFKKYLFYTKDIYTQDTAFRINQAIRNKSFIYEKVSFLACTKKIPIATSSAVTIIESICQETPQQQEVVRLVQLKDSGSTHFIYNDEKCRRYQLKPYIFGLTIADLSIEALSPQDFCETFVIR